MSTRERFLILLIGLGIAGGAQLGHRMTKCPVSPAVGQRNAYRAAAGVLQRSVVALRDSLALERRADTLGVSPDILRAVYTSADRHGLDREVWLRLVEHESSFRVRARSFRGAYGLAQVQLSTARTVDPDATVEDLLNPATNLELGAAYLERLLERYGDLRLALAAYNAGPTKVDTDPRARRRALSVYADAIALN